MILIKVPAVLLLAVMLLGIADIGVVIEEPFSILDLPRLQANAEAAVREAAEWATAAPGHLPSPQEEREWRPPAGGGVGAF